MNFKLKEIKIECFFKKHNKESKKMKISSCRN